MTFSVAVQVYSVRDDASADLRGTLEKIKKMGYDGVELAGLYGNDPADIKKMCDDIGLVPISAHVPYVDLVADTEGVLAQYATIGCKFVAVPYLNTEYRPGTDKFPEVIENIKMIGKKAKELGIQLVYHNHDFEFLKLDGKYALDILYDEVPAEYLETELDTCWVNVGGEVPSVYLRKYDGRARILHLKDFFGEKSDDMYELIGIDNKAPSKPKNFEFRPVGSGIQNFPEILDAAKLAGTEWIVVEQDKPSMGLTPLESIEKSRQYLKSIGY
ncbi:MAG: sugar phosphate isomerase/epimerase [Ruminococcaceae bacterium]|nr:sugar phosphate isomerase/epimerase [Oscillospiraceae bacterium]